MDSSFIDTRVADLKAQVQALLCDYNRDNLSPFNKGEPAPQQSVEKCRFALAIQPIVDAQSKQVLFSECLLRHRLSGQDFVSSKDFVLWAEDQNKSLVLDLWVLHMVFALLPTHKGKNFSFNVSRASIGSGDICEAVNALVAKHTNANKRLLIEITETAADKGRDDLPLFFDAVKDRGFPVAMDDFGAGQSHMAELQAFDFEWLKLDKSWLTRDQTVLSSLITQAHKLGKKVIAEGIETHEQAERMQATGCQALQGYLFGKPKLIDRF